MIKRDIVESCPPKAAEVLERLSTEGIPEGAVEVYRGRNRVVAIPLGGDRMINVKEFRVPHAINRLIYSTFRRSKARRAYEHALRLLAMGIATPSPYGWIERRNGMGLVGKSYFASEHLAGWTEIRYAERDTMPQLKAVCSALGALLYKFHESGVWMKDASPGNFLWRENSNGEIEFMVVDINRMAFDVRSQKKLMRNFGRLFEKPENILATARGYARAACREEEDILEIARREIARAQRIKARKQWWKGLFKF